MNLFGKGFRFGILLQVAIDPVFVVGFAIRMLLRRSAPEVVTSEG